MFNKDLAEIRFGYGLAPQIAGPGDAGAMLSGLTGPDIMAERFPIEDFATFRKRMAAAQAQFRIRRQNRGTDLAKAAMKQVNLLKKAARIDAAGWLVQSLLRAAHTPQSYRERLVHFWADHFTAYGKNGVLRRGAAPYIDDAIRPHIAGRFADLLKAAVLHPVMLHYLDQERSMGPGSKRALNSGGKFGLNENLAREVLELHTLGVNGPYSQDDVRQLAELLTGATFDIEQGFRFRKDWAEPGGETILGRTYAAKPGLGPIEAALDDLARHPATARHIARKLAVHFVSDTPDSALVDHLETRFRETEGDLLAVSAALLEHPASWETSLSNAKPPADFVASAFRALAIQPDMVAGLEEKEINRWLLAPMRQMGQLWQRPPGPDGWEEADSHWITPQGLAWRVTWAMSVPKRLHPALPDPRDFARTTLGSFANERVRFAAEAAESKSEAVGLVLLSPAFQRR